MMKEILENLIASCANKTNARRLFVAEIENKTKQNKTKGKCDTSI